MVSSIIGYKKGGIEKGEKGKKEANFKIPFNHSEFTMSFFAGWIMGLAYTKVAWEWDCSKEGNWMQISEEADCI